MAISAEEAKDQVRRGDWLPDGLVFVPDPRGRIIADWGLSHQTFGMEVSRPALFVLGPDGRVSWRHVTDNWRRRPSPKDVLAAVRASRAQVAP